MKFIKRLINEIGNSPAIGIAIDVFLILSFSSHAISYFVSLSIVAGISLSVIVLLCLVFLISDISDYRKKYRASEKN